jgi:hypothetical protein
MEPTEPRKDEASLTADPSVAWGTWMAARHAEDPAPRGWVVLLVVLGLPALLVVAVLSAVLTR